MEQAIRNKLRSIVTQCRKLLEDAVAQALQGQFGIYNGNKGEVHVEEETRMMHLAEEDQAYRKDILDHFEHIKARGCKPKEALDQLIREIAFTHLNRLCAYKLMEVRQVWIGGQRFREAVSRGQKSQGFMFYLADHPEDEHRLRTGQQDVAYRHFLDWLGSTLSEEIGVLFNPNDPTNRLYPPQRVLDQVLTLINSEELAGIWAEDETLGWVYQYFTPKELRDQARKESAAPCNSYELAFRNQFFTPRYVVEFLTDNTLGRIWYEMRRGDTKLTDQCRYMVRRPNEHFLEKGQTAPQDGEKSTDNLSQEELLKQPVYIAYRPKKDPRDLKILDPACGSGHFLLYCFDVLLTIYDEAYNDPDFGPLMRKDYPTLENLQRAVPGLILSHNLHGIDIDIRATQIAALALWLRCQRTYQEIGLKRDRPKITRSNIVCAEPMPGEKDMLKEFVATLQPKVLGHLVEVVFDKMKLAAEAGSLLKIEEELRGAIADGKKKWVDEMEKATDREGRTLLFSRAEMDQVSNKASQPQLFDFSEITDEQFWSEAEGQALAALRKYSAHATNSGKLKKQLFAEDAERGFAFIDLCQKRFDVVLMNPPFGDASKACNGLLEDVMAAAGRDMGCAFVSESFSRLCTGGQIAALLTATPLFQPTFSDWRQRLILGRERSTSVLAHLGGNVLDEATVIVCAFVLSESNNALAPFIRLDRCDDKQHGLLERVEKLRDGVGDAGVFLAVPDDFRRLRGSPVSYWMSASFRHRLASLPQLEGNGGTSKQGTATADEFRFTRAWWEVTTDGRWINYSKSSEYSPFWDDMTWLLNFGDDGKELRETGKARIQGTSYFGKPGVTYPSKSVLGFNPRVHPAGAGFGHSGSVVFPNAVSPACMLGYLASRPAEYALSLLTGSLQGEAGFRPVHYEVGIVGSLSFPQMAPTDQQIITSHAIEATQLVRSLFVYDETSRDFVSPFFHDTDGVGTLDEYAKLLSLHEIEVMQKVRQVQSQIDDVVGRSLGLTHSDLQEMNREFEARVAPTTGRWRPYFGAEPEPYSPNKGVSRLSSYCLGCVLGRWDIRFTTGKSKADPLADPFAPSPARPPGILFHSDQENLEWNEYPLRIDRDGVIPDDPNHTDDIVRRVREVLELIWKDRAEAVEKEACEILSVKDLRDYFRKSSSGGFWDDHVKRYSKSRRKAPIYWLLQSSKKNYALWFYYHRLDKDILFKALLNYVEPKIRLEESRLEPLRAQRAGAGAADKGVKKLEKDFERQEEFISELRDFEDKLRRVANLHLEPDLNDGVVLNIAPLWELVPWKEAKNYWVELRGGKYEWSSIGKQLREKGIVRDP